MAKIDITKTELIWPGKYSEDGTLVEVPRVSLPFQVIETVNESRATREANKARSMSLFDIYEGGEGDTFEQGWKNKLIWPRGTPENRPKRDSSKPANEREAGQDLLYRAGGVAGKNVSQ